MGVSRDDRRAAAVLLLLAAAGVGVRLWSGGAAGSPGAVGYRPSAAPRPVRDSVLSRAVRLARPLARGERIDVDRASVEEVARLPRVGPGLAARIVQDRDRNGPFGSLEGMDRVSGVGPTVLEAVRAHVTFGGAGGLMGGSADGRMGGWTDRRTGGRSGGLFEGSRGYVSGGAVVSGPADRTIRRTAHPSMRPSAHPSIRPSGAPVSINTATAAELAQLPGIGKVRAEAIVAERNRAGPFRTVDELRRVPGLGARTIKRLAPSVVVP
jgi:competence ComEA-like helix-hairpin-helix protein